ncbi:hypothetical protein [Nocardia camponoti]|uniref:hypothetical protein n=1 Tax=Nocardia camponoti TaxID=1616106 RepID=UPI00166DE35F|nr:hypothetical protein [Nocardia camponoti]
MTEALAWPERARISTPLITTFLPFFLRRNAHADRPVNARIGSDAHRIRAAAIGVAITIEERVTGQR